LGKLLKITVHIGRADPTLEDFPGRRKDHAGRYGRDPKLLSHCRLLLDVDFHRHEVVRDYLYHPRMGKHLLVHEPAGLAPGRPKMDQSEFAGLGSFPQGPGEIGPPANAATS
jgi:hypothetical protein